MHEVTIRPCGRIRSTLIVRRTESSVVCLTLFSRLLKMSPSSELPAVPSPSLCRICVTGRRRRWGLPDMVGHATPWAKYVLFWGLSGFGFCRLEWRLCRGFWFL